MLVVADSSPLIVLINLGRQNLLPELFGQVLIPPAVATELASERRPEPVRTLIAHLPSWLVVRRPEQVQQFNELHRGELEAISLAKEVGADLLLVDDRAAFRVAIANRINAIGTVRVLELAAERELVDLRQVFEELRQTDFWISPALLDERLNQFESRFKRRTP